MIDDLEIANVGKVQEEQTKAATNKEAAQNILSQFLAVAGNADMNKILVDIADAGEELEAAEKLYKSTINSCMPVVLQEYLD